MSSQQETTFDKAYAQSLDLAARSLLEKDIAACCRCAGAVILQQTDTITEIELLFMNTSIRLTFPDFTFSSDTGTPGIWEKIILLHYLSNDTEIPLTGSLINYRQVKSGAVYFPTFEKRSTIPFAHVFGSDTARLIDAAHMLGGEKTDYGDFGVKIPALPYVPLYFVIWEGDDEFPPSATILFDSSIEQRLSAEDIVVLTQQIVFKLIKVSKKS